jgi:hypothetical protein
MTTWLNRQFQFLCWFFGKIFQRRKDGPVYYTVEEVIRIKRDAHDRSTPLSPPIYLPSNADIVPFVASVLKDKALCRDPFYWLEKQLQAPSKWMVWRSKMLALFRRYVIPLDSKG